MHFGSLGCNLHLFEPQEGGGVVIRRDLLIGEDDSCCCEQAAKRYCTSGFEHLTVCNTTAYRADSHLAVNRHESRIRFTRELAEAERMALYKIFKHTLIN